MIRRRILPTVGAVLAAASLVAGPLSGAASAAPPSGQFLNPDEDGPGNRVSDKPDGTDELYHFVVRLKDPEGLNDISGVEIQIEDGDPDTDWETIGTATRVGTTDTWELFWDLSAHQPQSDVDDDAGFVRAVVFDSSGVPTFVPSTAGEPVVFQDQNAATAEITDPPNGGSLGFFDGPDADSLPEAVMQGTASPEVDQPSEIELFYTTQSDAAVDPAWVDCEENVTVSGGTWRGMCELATGAAPASVTGVAVRPDLTDSATDEVGDQSGDAHRVTGYQQTAEGATVTVEPATDNQTIGFCNTYVAVVTDVQNRPIIGANIDVHATGPADNLQFAVNLDDPNDADEVSDPFAAPQGGAHTTEPAAGCDTAGEDGAGDAPEDNDSDNMSSLGAGGQQGNHLNPAGSDTKHIEGSMDFDGFQFSIDSESTGTTNIEAWFDANDDDLLTTLPSPEPSDTATKNWQVATIAAVDAFPETDLNSPGTTHTVTGKVTDQNGNPVPGVILRFRVMSGPHADDNLDEFATTPPGYFGSCTTNANGRCSQSYEGDETGVDTIVVWTNSPGETGAAVFEPDADDPQDEVTKRWFAAVEGPVCIDMDPNTDTNGPHALHEITAFVTDGTFDEAGDTADEPGQVHNDCGGNPLQGVGVIFEISDDDPDAALVPDNTDGENQETVATDASGRATVTLDNQEEAEGDNTVTGDVEGTTEETGDRDVEKVWSRLAGPVCIDVDPDTATNPASETHEIAAFVTDGTFDEAGDAADAEGEVDNDCIGEAIEGAAVAFEITDDDPDAALVPDIDGDENRETATTDEAGVATVTLDVKDNVSGTNSVTAEVQDTETPALGDTDAEKTWTRVTCPGFENDPRNQVVGTSGDDELEGTAEADIICGLGGDDTITSDGGNDEVLGGSGNDDIRTGAGLDEGSAGGGSDELRGGKGGDDLKGNKGSDALFGQKGPDTLTGGAGIDLCRGGPGNDETKGCEN